MDYHARLLNTPGELVSDLDHLLPFPLVRQRIRVVDRSHAEPSAIVRVLVYQA